MYAVLPSMPRKQMRRASSRKTAELASSHMQGPPCTVRAAGPMRGQGQWGGFAPVGTQGPGGVCDCYSGDISACESFTVFSPIINKTFTWIEHHEISIPGGSCFPLVKYL